MGMSGKRHPFFRRTGMNNADKIIKRCRALALAGMIGITSLGSSLPAFAAGPWGMTHPGYQRFPQEVLEIREILILPILQQTQEIQIIQIVTIILITAIVQTIQTIPIHHQQYYHKYQCLEKGKRYVPDVRWKRDPECAPSWY